ncbi:Ig-like domain-containing protein [Myxococcus landrumensis]|uniref:Ig-like domain-containing protein n=1 Tax=Myxococcus landrumensis TaxID=2813577 RepID=A0ABX7N1K0_9BACT|nr:Ig-like domain-containing protein [Myxococcus landrumus]QSQ12590.1 Ig-like domain-containing protein [Myxococcus landrumus]
MSPRSSRTAALLSTCALLVMTGCGSDDPSSPTPAPSDVTKPHVTASSPAEGATDVLPVQRFKLDAKTTGLQRVVTVSFSEPMDRQQAQVSLIDLGSPTTATRALIGTWSEDGKSLSITIPRPQADLPPLEEDRPYALDLTALRDVSGNALDAAHEGLKDGRLDFTTGKRDRSLEHACAHALLDVPIPLTAGASPTAAYPSADTSHKVYTLTLPASGASFLGYTEVVSAEREEPIVMYLDQALTVAVHDVTEAETVIPTTLAPAPEVCAPVITHTLKFTAPAGDRFLRLTHGPTARDTSTFVFERS